MADPTYTVNGVPLEGIRNRNEKRVARLMPEVLREFSDYRPSYLDVQDVYALTLNNLPARYVQRGTIVLREPLSDDDIRQEIRYAVETVEMRPTGSEED